MLTIDPRMTPELLERTFERVYTDMKAAKLGDPGVGQICSIVRSPRFRRWALECSSDLSTIKEIPEQLALTVLELLTAGMLVGIELQKSASETDALENFRVDPWMPDSPQS